MIALAIAVGAIIGAPARYLTDRAVQGAHDTVFPWGTLAVNVIASFVLGVVAAAGTAVSPELSALLATGFCGSLSTYSTFSYETMRLIERRERFYAAANVVVSLVAGLGAAGLGWIVGADW